jgi:hypothetical protein
MAFIRTRIIWCTESFTTERFGLSDLVELYLLSLDWRRPSVLRACTQKETKEDLRTGEVICEISCCKALQSGGDGTTVACGAGNFISSPEAMAIPASKSLGFGGLSLWCGF